MIRMSVTPYPDSQVFAVDVLLVDGIISRLEDHVGEAELVAGLGMGVGETTVFVGYRNKQGITHINAYILDSLAIFIGADALHDGVLLGQGLHGENETKKHQEDSLSFHNQSV